MVKILDKEAYVEFLAVLQQDSELPLDQSPVPWLTQEECLRQDISSILLCTDIKRLREWHSIPHHVPLWDDVYTEVKASQAEGDNGTKYYWDGEDWCSDLEVATTLNHAKRIRGAAEATRKLIKQQEVDMVHKEIMGWKMS